MQTLSIYAVSACVSSHCMRHIYIYTYRDHVWKYAWTCHATNVLRNDIYIYRCVYIYIHRVYINVYIFLHISIHLYQEDHFRKLQTQKHTAPWAPRVADASLACQFHTCMPPARQHINAAFVKLSHATRAHVSFCSKVLAGSRDRLFNRICMLCKTTQQPHILCFF